MSRGEDLPETVKVIFREPHVQEASGVELQCYSVEANCVPERPHTDNYVSFSYGPWFLEEVTDSKYRAFLKMYGEKRLSITIDDETVYLTKNSATALIALLQQFVK